MEPRKLGIWRQLKTKDLPRQEKIHFLQFPLCSLILRTPSKATSNKTISLGAL